MKTVTALMLSVLCLSILVVIQVHKNKLEKLQSQLANIEREKNETENSLFRLIEFSSPDINMMTQLFSFEDTVLLKDIITSKTLIYKFSNNDCHECINQQIKLLNKIKDLNPSFRVIALYEIDNTRSYKLFFKSFAATLPFWAVKNFPILDHAYFIIDVNGRCSHFYFPTTDNPQYSEKYLSLMKRVF